MHQRGAARLFPLLLALSSQLHAAAGAESATPEERSRNVTFGTGQPLRSLPGAHILQGQSNAYTIDATFGPVSVTVRPDASVHGARQHIISGYSSG